MEVKEFTPFEKRFNDGRFASRSITWEALALDAKSTVFEAIWECEQELKRAENGSDLFRRIEEWYDDPRGKMPSLKDYPTPKYLTGVQADVDGRETLITLVERGVPK